MGVMWVSRGQAQNAADAGALAGAVALMKDGGSTTEAGKSAIQWASNNAIFGATNSAANVRITFSGPRERADRHVTSPPFRRVATSPDAFVSTSFGIRRTVRIAGGATLGAPIPTLFGPLIGITQQRVRATATAEVASGNMVRCMLPFAVIDRWADSSDENVNTAYSPTMATTFGRPDRRMVAE